MKINIVINAQVIHHYLFSLIKKILSINLRRLPNTSEEIGSNN